MGGSVNNCIGSFLTNMIEAAIIAGENHLVSWVVGRTSKVRYYIKEEYKVLIRICLLYF